MVQAGLYEAGADPVLDEAVRLWPALDRFLARISRPAGSAASFAELARILAG